MTKRVKMTPEIEKKIRWAVGDPEMNVSNLVVFESRSLTTEPIVRKGGFHKDAVVPATTLRQMAEFINQPGKAIPLQIMHDTDVLPVGKVFSGQLMSMDNGHTELRTLFYIPSDKVQLVNDIENSVIDEVSVGFLSDHAFCSECDFDYFGEKATPGNFYTLTCDNNHTIGVDGVHVRLVGLRDWAELSLANRGAAKDAKILSRAKQAMGKDAVEKLAASGTPMEARLTTVNYKLEAQASNKGDLSMDKETLALFQAKADEVAQANVKLTQANTTIEGLNKQVTELTATVTAKDAELKTLKEASTDATALTAKVTEAETKLKDAFDKLFPHAKAALTASGVAEADLPKDIVALAAMVEDKGLKLHQLVGSDPKTVATKTDVKNEDSDYRKQAFKTRN